jgi:hypothetical protein
VRFIEGSRKSGYSIAFMMRYPSLCSVNPMLKMMWWVPVTHSAPSSFSVPARRSPHSSPKSISEAPFERIESLRPILRFRMSLGSVSAGEVHFERANAS